MRGLQGLLVLASFMFTFYGSADEKAVVDLNDHPETQGAFKVIDAWLQGRQTYDRIPGVSFGLVVDQELVFSKGYGRSNLRRKAAPDENTIYSVCSISKLFTSVATLLLLDQGKLALRDPLKKHLPWFELPQSSDISGPVRLHGMLTHSSGLPRESDYRYWTGDFPFPDREQMLERLAEQEMLYRSDSLFQYSNLGMSLLGEVVATVSGQPYEQYVQSEILDPLQLADTRPYFPRDLHGKQMAVGYSGFGRDQKRKAVEPFDTKAVAAAAGFTSTVADLAKFASWQFQTLDSEDANNSVLHPETLREMQRVQWTDPDWETTWGLGFVVNRVGDNTVVGHGGGCPGYITAFLLVPKMKVAAIALTNAGDGPAFELASAALQAFGPALAKAKEPKAVENDHLKEYEGNYAGDVWGGEEAVRVWGEQLAVVRIPSDNLRDVVKLKHVDGDKFVRLQDGNEREAITFIRDEDGQVIGMEQHSNVAWKIDES